MTDKPPPGSPDYYKHMPALDEYKPFELVERVIEGLEANGYERVDLELFEWRFHLHKRFAELPGPTLYSGFLHDQLTEAGARLYATRRTRTTGGARGRFRIDYEWWIPSRVMEAARVAQEIERQYAEQLRAERGFGVRPIFQGQQVTFKSRRTLKCNEPEPRLNIDNMNGFPGRYHRPESKSDPKPGIRGLAADFLIVDDFFEPDEGRKIDRQDVLNYGLDVLQNFRKNYKP